MVRARKPGVSPRAVSTTANTNQALAEVRARLRPAIPAGQLIIPLDHAAVWSDDQGLLMTLGQVEIPVLLGSPQEQQAEAKNITEVTLNIVGRFRLSPARARELHRALGAVLGIGEQAGKDV